MAEGTKRSTSGMLLIGCIAIAGIGVVVVGILAAIAIPSYLRYMRRARTSEAQANIMAITHEVEVACEEGTPPGPAGPTPAIPGPQRQFATFGPEWSSVGFAPSDPLYYSYSMTRPDGNTIVIVAEGDLDGNGTRSHFESTCALVSPTSCPCSPTTVTNELE